MSIQTLSLAPTNSTVTTFRAWGSAVSGALAAAGLVQTVDSGQINWTTVIRPTAISQSVGYEIWRFNDALQSTRPVFLRVDYGSAQYAINDPGLYFAVGTATDGAGTLLSTSTMPNTTLWSPGNPTLPFSIPQSGPVFFGNGNDYSTTSLSPLYVASDGGSSVMVAGWYNAVGSSFLTQTGGCMVIERMRDQDGTPNGDGLFVLRQSATATPFTVFLITGKATQFWGGGGGTGAPVLHGGKQGVAPVSGVVGSTLNTYPVFTGVSPQMNGPSKHLVAVYSGDQSVNTQFDLTIYNTSATFRSMGTHSSGWSNEGGSVAITGAFRVA